MVLRQFIIEVAIKLVGQRSFEQAEEIVDKVGRSAKRTDKSLTDLQKAEREAGREARKLAKEEREAAKALREQARAAEKAKRENQKLAKANAARLSKQFAKRDREAAKALRDKERAAAKLARTVARKLAKAERDAAKETARLTRFVEKHNKKIEKAAEKQRKLAAETRKAALAAKKASRSWSAISGEVLAVGQAAGVVALAIGAVALPVLTVGAKFESLRAQLDNLLGSAEAGGKAFDFIRDFATKTPFQLSEVTTAFVKLQGRGIDPTSERLTALGDIAAANNKTLDDITEAALDATQGEGERLKEFGIKLRKNGDQVSLAFRGTKLEVANTEEAITDALVKLGQLDGVAGSMAAQMNTLKGQVSNAQDALEGFLNTAAQSGPLQRTGEILAELRDKFLDPKNAKLFGEALNELFKIIQDALEGVEPDQVTAAFKLLVNVIKLLALALKPFIWLWKQGLELIGDTEKRSEGLLKLVETFDKVTSGALSVRDAIGEVADAFSAVDDAAIRTGTVMTSLQEKAEKALAAIKAAITGVTFKELTEEELRAAAAGDDPAKRKQAADELRRRDKEADRQSQQQRANERKAVDLTEQAREKKFGVGAGIESAAAGVGKAAAEKEFRRLRRSGVAEKQARRQAAAFGEQRAGEEAVRLRAGGKRGKGKGKQFFDVEESFKREARSRGEAFAAEELERLVAAGEEFGAAQIKARAAGKERADELEARFKKAGRILEKTKEDSILDIIGLKGPGSVLAGRPPPEVLTINIVMTFNAINGDLVVNLDGANTETLEAAAGAGAQAAVEAGMAGPFQMFLQNFEKAIRLQGDRIVTAAGGGRRQEGPPG